MKRFLLWLTGLTTLSALVLGLALLWLTRDQKATHRNLVQADLPHLISVRDFFADTKAEWNYRPSMDGKYIAWRGTRLTQEGVFYGESTDNPIGWFPDVRDFYWNDISAHLMILRDGRLWKVDPLNADEEAWADVTPRGMRNWSWPSRVQKAEDRWVISSRDRNPAFSDLYTVKQDGSDKQLLIENDGLTLNWFLSKDLTAQLRAQRLEDSTDTVIQVPDGDGWRDLLRVPLMTTFYVLEILPDGSKAFALSARGRDKVALVQLNMTDGTETVLHAEDDEDIFNVVNLDPYDGQIDAVISERGQSDITPLSKRGDVLARLIKSKGEKVDVDDLRWAGNGRFVTASLSPNGQSYIYHLFDLDEATQVTLGTYSFRQKHLDAIVTTEEVTIPARDGLELPALLVRPKGVVGPAPMVLEVHGGPANHLNWEYHHFRQLLANRGYAVLAVNFRGSTGFGKAHQDAGFRQFGRAMQDDLEDAAAWAVNEGIADPDALAINGGSYGGYASAMAILRESNPFSAAIVEHAMLDVAYQSNYPPHAWGLNLPFWHRYFGDPKDVSDLETMRKFSPVNLVENLDTPVLVIAGKRDRVVGFEQTEAFVRAAEDLGREVELKIFEDEGHGLHRWQSNVQHARQVEDFLHKHLGGRSGGQSLVEYAIEILD